MHSSKGERKPIEFDFRGRSNKYHSEPLLFKIDVFEIKCSYQTSRGFGNKENVSEPEKIKMQSGNLLISHMQIEA